MSTSIARHSASPNGTAVTAGLTELEAELVAIFVDLVGLFGLPRSYGEIYGLLYASPRPLSFTDIQEKLDLSKGSVSQGLRALRDLGAIRPTEGLDDRREHFAPETELRQLLAGFLRESIQPHLKTGATRIGDIRARHKAELAAKTDENRLLLGRLEKLQGWHRKGGALLPLLSKVIG